MKRKKLLAALVSLVMAVALTGCGAGETVRLSYYGGENKGMNGRSVLNNALFYDNTLIQGNPDPQVLDNTARDGYYYLFATSGGTFPAMRSKNLAEWENVGPVFDRSDAEVIRATTPDFNWAPEVIYDDVAQKYYLFFSSLPEVDASVQAGQGVVALGTELRNGVESYKTGYYNMYVAVADKPDGPYILQSFDRDINVTGGKVLTKAQAESGEYAYTLENGTYYEAAFPHFYRKFCLLAPDELSRVMQKNGVGMNPFTPNATFFGCIDPHPYVDPVSNNKYLYFKTETEGYQWNINVVVQMKDWLTPMWETAAYVTVNGYKTIEDWKKQQNRGVSYEQDGQVCNEGAHVIYRENARNGKGLYYFTFSVNDYGTSSYQVGMAVSESPTGPFRKLEDREGGLLLCSSSTMSKTISGAGHHSFVKAGDQTFIVYHRHKDYSAGGTNRYTAVDEMEWITVKDIYGDDMVVPYVNGPTDSVQPLPATYSGYRNLAPEAAVTASSETDVSRVNDKLLSVHKMADPDFMEYVQEAVITKTTTFTFDFERARTLRAVMVYNSAFENKVFRNLSLVEFTLADGSKRIIEDLNFDMDQYCEISELTGEIRYVMPGAAAFAEFYEIPVKTVRITVDVPAGQDAVGISEIRLLGKD